MSDEKSKVGQELWGGRFSEPTDRFVQRFTASEAFDRELASELLVGPVKPNAMAVCSRSIGKVVPANAAAPSGD